MSLLNFNIKSVGVLLGVWIPQHMCLAHHHDSAARDVLERLAGPAQVVEEGGVVEMTHSKRTSTRLWLTLS